MVQILFFKFLHLYFYFLNQKSNHVKTTYRSWKLENEYHA
jgi:hypothetical protein